MGGGSKEMVSVSMKGSCGCVKCQCGIGILVRLFHFGLCVAMTTSLLWHDTVLRQALVDMQRPVYGGCFIGLLVVSLTLYFIACYTDPGYVFVEEFKKAQALSASIEMDTADEQSEEEHETTDMVNQPLDKRNKYKLRYCDYCEIQPPLRSKHCEDCKMCVRRHDHHCPWLENCVGERNHRYFWLFLMVTSALIIWTFIIIWESFATKSTWTDWFHANLVLFLNIVVLVLSGPVVLGLFVFHTYLMGTGLSTWEVASRDRITYLKYLTDDHNPFDEGCVKNVYHFMCWCKIRKWETMYAQKAKFKDTGV